MQLEDYLNDLKIFYNDIKDTVILDNLKTKNAKDYVRGLAISKPEALASDKLLKPIMMEIGIENFPEGRIGGGFADFILPSSKELGLPVALELKPLHNSAGDLQPLSKEYNALAYQAQSTRSNQIVRYILGNNESRGVEYVVLTNLQDVYIFDKSCIVKFEPAKKETFIEFINGISVTKNIYDYLRRETEEFERRDLDKHFFQDLKRWFGHLQSLEWVEDSQYNSALLLNKLIFALTLEDFMIIDYRETWETFSRNFKKWSTKGPEVVLRNFFNELDNFLYEYYDTELFIPSRNILTKLKDSEESYTKFLNTLKNVAGFVDEPTVFSGGLYSYSFRLINEDVFGKSYETFLAENRKDSGIYYTPTPITRRMASKLVDQLFSGVKNKLLEDLKNEDFDGAEEDVKKLTGITVIDPACGSGAFLISVLREISKIYEEIIPKTEWALKLGLAEISPGEQRRRDKTLKIRKMLGVNDGGGKGVNRELLSKIILRHIYGADIDSMALNVAKVNVWKETVKLNPASFHYQSLPKSINHILPDLKINFINGNSVVGLPDNFVMNFLSKNFKEKIMEMIRLRNEYLEDTSKAEIAEKIEEIKVPMRHQLEKEFLASYPHLEKPLFYPLEFFFLYFDSNGEPLEEGKRGFSGAIGNPPWNNLKPNKKEFASKHPEIFGEGISKYSISGRDFEKLFEEKLVDTEVKGLWDSYSNYYDSLSDYVKKNYELQYSGDYSLQKVFLEKFIDISRDAFAILVPSNFHTDEGSYYLRKEIMNNWELKELISFENRGKVWFPDIDSRFKFDMLFVSKKKTGKPFKARFYVSSAEEIDLAFDYPVSLIERLSPEVLGITEFRSDEDVRIVEKIRGDHKLLRDYNIQLVSEFHTTNDNDLFNVEGNGLPVMKGENIHQYNPNFSNKILYWIDEKAGRARLLEKEIHRIERMAREYGRSINISGSSLDNFVKNIVATARAKFENRTFFLDYELPRLAYRAIARSTDERTLIAAIVRERVFLIHSLNYIRPIS
ncbi:MAG: DNA methyltransferase, partial [Thermoplasmatales archaeon]